MSCVHRARVRTATGTHNGYICRLTLLYVTPRECMRCLHWRKAALDIRNHPCAVHNTQKERHRA